MSEMSTGIYVCNQCGAAPQPCQHATASGDMVSVPRELLEQWKTSINTLSSLTLKSERREACIELKQSIADALAAPAAVPVGDCPHADPHRYCDGCKADPCPIGLGRKKP